MSDTTSLTSHEVDWDKVPADENGVKAIGVGDAPLAFVIDCAGLGRVEAAEFLDAENDLNARLWAQGRLESPTFSEVMEEVKRRRQAKQRQARMAALLPLKRGIW
jgi:hypothetical protein